MTTIETTGESAGSTVIPAVDAAHKLNLRLLELQHFLGHIGSEAAGLRAVGSRYIKPYGVAISAWTDKAHAEAFAVREEIKSLHESLKTAQAGEEKAREVLVAVYTALVEAAGLVPKVDGDGCPFQAELEAGARFLENDRVSPDHEHAVDSPG